MATGFALYWEAFMRKARLLGLSLLAMSMVGLGHAQSTNAGDIRGTVTDPTGALVPEVTVTVLNIETGVSQSRLDLPQ